ncbi:hypothetical protein B0H13DRAFT_1050224 [Mycena leptocephala]|nr:hypothetical protein B0H13DRAFT_1050224 [Mycena leptocephala]
MPSNSSPKATATTSSRTSSANPCPRTSSPAASACSPHCTLTIRHPPCLLCAQFLSTFMRTLTASWRSRLLPLALAPAFVHLTCRLALPHRPSRRESCADSLHSHRSDIRARSCTMRTGESLPHSSMRMDAQTRLSSGCASSFACAGCTPRSLPSVLCVSAGCACHGTSTSRPSSSYASGSAVRPVRAPDSAAAVTSPHLRISCGCRWRRMKMAKRADVVG